MKKTMFTTTILCLLAFTVGCSSTMTREDIAREEIEINEVRNEAKIAEMEKRQDANEEQLAETPEWIIEPPRADKTGLFGVGFGSDGDPVISSRKAMLQAKYSLASTLKSELSGEDTMSDGGENGQYRYVINSFVNKVEITGYEVVKRKVIPQKTL